MADITLDTHETIPALLRASVDATPERDAFVFFDHDITLTYVELDEQVRRVANGLRSNGVRKGTHVAMMMPNVIEFPITWLAIAWLGAVSIQINPSLTSKELDYVLNDAGADFLILTEGCLDTLAGMRARDERLSDSNVIVTGADWDELATAAPLAPEPPSTINRHDLVSILYTSGTTGFPKGCMLDHGYWTQIAAAALFGQGVHTPRNSLIYEPMFYIQGNALFLASLLANATIFCPERSSISNFLPWVERYDIDYCAFPVPAAHVMHDYPAAMGQSLQWVHAWYFHGDTLAQVEDRFDVIGRDSYAMTENGLVTYVPVDRPDLARNGSVGVAAPGREIRLVDSDGNDVAPGEVGEAWTAGPGHLHGYYRKTEANKQSFVDGWFRTGDLMRLDDDGGYYLVGRLKDMIKRSGENISAAEVEASLSSFAGVAYAAVVAVPDSARGEEVKAYLQLKEGLTSSDITPEAVFEHCAAQLSAFKVPRYLEYVDSFPMTASDDKVAKAQLVANIDDLTANAFDRQAGQGH